MNEKQKQYSGSLEINDLIDDAVNNAVARRSEFLGSDDTLSDQESANIAGGISNTSVVVAGRFPITTVGIIVLPPITKNPIC
jgi:hypothetical protein